jgi:DinB family protein
MGEGDGAGDGRWARATGLAAGEGLASGAGARRALPGSSVMSSPPATRLTTIATRAWSAAFRPPAEFLRGSSMQDYVSSLRAAIARSTPALLAISDGQSLERPQEGKWSPREVIGHLVDSASNNHQRFVRARFQDDLVFTGYEQDAWVAAQQYQDAPWAELVTLWELFNLHLARVMETTPESVRLRVRHRHNLDALAWRPVPRESPATLDYFMNDYVGHLQHHLRQVLGNDWFERA